VFSTLNRRLRRVVASASLAAVAIGLGGCGQEGAGTIKIEDPNGIRAKMGGGGEVKAKKPMPAEAAKVKEQEQNAPTKHFQRG